MVEIFGIIEKTWWKLWSIEVEEVHRDVFEKAEKMKNLKVGVELPEGLPSIKYGNIHIYYPKIYLDLYEKLKGNNSIVFLEDENLLRNIAEIYSKIPPISTSEEYRLLSEPGEFRLWVKAEYLHKVKRSEVMANKIIDQNLDAAFMGAAHAFYICKERNFQNVFIETPTNANEVEREIMDAYLLASSEGELNYFLKRVPSLTYSLVHVDLLPVEMKGDLVKNLSEIRGIERLNMLVDEGRFSNSIPDFIGSWSLEDLPIRGYFEMYVEEKNGNEFKGKIIDCIGDATFKGSVDENRVRFIKEYFNKFDIFGGPIPGEILYEGERNGEIYVGKFISEDIHESGNFVMSEYSKEKAEKILNANKGTDFISTFEK